MITRRMLLSAIVAASGSLSAVLPAVSQSYPTRPITMIVPFPAGGALDTVARVLSERMRTSLGQPVIIENVSGGAGNVGVARLARAAPDGYTLDIGGWVTHVLNGAIFPLKFDVRTDFEPVCLIATQPMLIIGKKTLPAETLKDLIVWLTANPDKALVGHAGVGTTGHISGLFFQTETGARLQFVPYRGLSLAMQDLLAGHIDLIIDQAVNALPHVRNGAVKAYAITARSRLAALPDIPTVDEAGMPGFYVTSWQAIWAPKGTPREIINTLNAAVADALADPGVRARLADLGQEIFARRQQTPEALGDFHKAEIEKWWPIIKAANIKPE
jgi:tripartite-type tricarboxylate transporter receptor subunit TctC